MTTGSDVLALHNVSLRIMTGPPSTGIVFFTVLTVSVGNEVLLAAGGEDSFISIWRFTASEMDASEFEFQVHKFGKYSVIFDTLIMGHEGWINSLAWDESDPNAQGCHQLLTVIM